MTHFLPPLTCAPLLLAALAVWGCGTTPPDPFLPVPGPEGEGEVGSWVHSGGLRRAYDLVLPEEVAFPEDAGQPAPGAVRFVPADGGEGRQDRATRPLLILLHGAGGSAGGFRRWTGLDTLAAKRGWVVAAPQGLDRSWAVGCGGCTSAGSRAVDDVRFIETLVRHLAAALPVDTARVFLVGHSLGAQFVHHYACTAALRPAGIVAVSGLWLRRGAARCPPQPPMAVLMIHGDRDPILPWDGPRDSAGALSMPEAFRRWSALLGCDPVRGPPAGGEAPAPASGQRTVASPGESAPTPASRRRAACPEGTEVTLYRLRGAGHGWPGAPRTHPSLGPTAVGFDASAVVMEFLERHATPEPLD